MLELKPNCECCDKNLPPDSREAMVCSFECTFCISCNKKLLKGICPNCGGNLVERPTRAEKWLARNPASIRRVIKEGGCLS